MADSLSNIKGILFDINGVFHVDNRLEGAVEIVKKIQDKFPCRFVTNTTTKSRETFHQSLVDIGLPILPISAQNTLED